MSPAVRLTNRYLVLCGERWPDTVRFWRTNAGAGVGMSVVHQAIALIEAGAIKAGVALLRRPVSFGPTGGTDLTGFAVKSWGQQIITAEVKAGRDSLRDSQKEWHSFLKEFRIPIIIVRDDLDQAIRDTAVFVEGA